MNKTTSVQKQKQYWRDYYKLYSMGRFKQRGGEQLYDKSFWGF